MKVEIKNRFTGKVICSGEFVDLKECCEQHRASLDGANLDGASLVGASLDEANLDGANLSRANLDGASLYGANLSRANLDGASLHGASLVGANLSRASLHGAKKYYMSHAFCKEIIRRQTVNTFTTKEWSIIGQITIHRLCWGTIKKRYGRKALPVFKKIKKAGFGEYYGYYSKLLKSK